MEYRNLGNTGIKVSTLGFGCMRLPKITGKPQTVDNDASVKLFHYAYKSGINFFDSAYIYDNGDSERALGIFLKEVPRENIVISTKSPVGHPVCPIPSNQPTGELWRKSLEEQLKRLGTNYIDIYHFHDTHIYTFSALAKGKQGLLKEAKKAKEEGLIRHMGISSHDTPTNIINIIELAEGTIEVIIVQYNLLDRANEAVIDYARKNGIGVAIMGPVGGGKLMHPSETYQHASGRKSTPEIALRFVLANPGVSIAMSGMNTMEQLKENIATVSHKKPLTKNEKVKINKLQKNKAKILDLYCTNCRYCMPCPNEINIPGNFNAMINLKVHGLVKLARESYENLGKGKAINCKECTLCAGKCPQNIDIQKRLKEVAKTFERTLTLPSP